MNVPALSPDGFEIWREVVSAGQLEDLRVEADVVAMEVGTTCVRQLAVRSALFAELANSAAVRELIPGDLRLVRGILFDKTPERNWPVAWHQDTTICIAEKKRVVGYGAWSVKDGVPHVQPPIVLLENMVTARLHLDDTPAGNGALRVIPGSHLAGKLSSREIEMHAAGRDVTCDCAAGDVLLMSPLILHASARAVSPSRRRVVHFEFARDEDLHRELKWGEGG